MKSQRMDIPLAFKLKNVLNVLASTAKRVNTTVRIGKFDRKFLH